MFRLTNRFLWTAAVAALALLPGWASASMITFTFSGTGTGSLGGTNFSNAAFQVTVVGNTNDITTPFGSDVPLIVDLPAAINIAGLGIATFSNPVYVFNNQSVQVVGFGDYSFGDFQGDFWDQASPSLATYGLNTSFGPISTSDLSFAIFTDTNRGELIVNQAGPATFLATAAGVSSVPEPASAIMLLCGTACAAALRRRANATGV